MKFQKETTPHFEFLLSEQRWTCITRTGRGLWFTGLEVQTYWPVYACSKSRICQPLLERHLENYSWTGRQRVSAGSQNRLQWNIGPCFKFSSTRCLPAIVAHPWIGPTSNRCGHCIPTLKSKREYIHGGSRRSIDVYEKTTIFKLDKALKRHMVSNKTLEDGDLKLTTSSKTLGS